MNIGREYQQLKNVYHWLQAQLWRAVYGWPDKKLTLFGVTGTNGKTTTTIVLGSILRAAQGRDKVGLLSTEVFWLGAEERVNETHMTSTDAKIVFRYLRQMVEKGVTHVVLEMTSHALDQHRLAGISLSGAIILNIAHEHLDYHKTMDEYATAKGKIVHYLRSDAPLVAKKDNEWVRKALAVFYPSISPEGEIPPLEKGRKVVWFTSRAAQDISTPLPGDFNKENVLAASLLAEACGVAKDHIGQGVAAVTQVPGRMEWISLENRNHHRRSGTPQRGKSENRREWPRVVVDFALTPYSYERLFKYLRAETKGRLFAVFGAAGRRDRAKRPLITKIVAQYADEIILTQDEPYDDPEEEIYQQLEAGLVGSTISWQRIPDRREAIKYALQKAQAGDIVAVTGMGNFTTRVVGDKKIPWNDRQVILELAKELK